MKRWWIAMAWPLVLAVLAHLAFPPVGARAPDRISVLPDGTQVQHWNAASTWAFAMVAAVALLAGWRVLRQGAGGRLAAAVAGALVGLVTLGLVPCALGAIALARGTLIPPELRPGLQGLPLAVFRDLCEISLLGAVIVVPVYALFGFLGGWLATRSRRPAVA